MMGYQILTPLYPLRVEALISVHYFEYTSNYYFEGETHDFWEFLYVDKGRLDVQAGEQQYHLEKGQMIFHEPGEFHALRACGIAPNLVVASFVCRSEAMQFFKQQILRMGDAERVLLAAMIKEAQDAFASPLDDPLTMQLTRRNEAPIGAEQLVVHSIEQLLIQLLRRGTQPHSSQAGNLIQKRSQQDFFDRIIHYFEVNIANRLTLADVCRDNLVGRSYLQKIFREKTGGGAMEYFGLLKIETAKQYIRNGSHNFTEIASLLGYNSIHYFSRHFKKATGMTPSEYASSVKVLAAKNRLN